MDTRTRIVTAMTELLRRQGYGSTGMKQLVAASGAPIGSLYHHFPGGKREIAAEALRTSGAVYIQLVPLLLDPYDDLPAGIGAFFSRRRRHGWHWLGNMCPVGTVTGEVADVEPALREVAAEVIGGWIEDATTYFVGRGLGRDDARELTHAVLAALEGGFVLSPRAPLA